jgi:hypothetical protein
MEDRKQYYCFAPKTLRSKIITDTEGDLMTGHESKNKTKERIILSCW